jgi:hypothetical protein
MKQDLKPATEDSKPLSFVKPVLIGSGVALLLIIIFLSGGNPNPAWPKLWIVRPLIIVPLAGAAGGACYYFLNRLHTQHGWNRALTLILSLVVYLIGLWLGTVLGLDGTYWD